MLLKGDAKFNDVTVSIVPANGASVADFDFDLHVEKDYLGAESEKLAYEGKGTYNGVGFSFSGPVA